MDCLYVSHTGMTEPLGRSQVLAYLFGLQKGGLSIEVVSHEPVGTPAAAVAATRELMGDHGVAWRPLVRSASHGLGVKVWESSRAVLTGLVEALRGRPRIVHARSYLPAAVADVLATVTPGAKMLFDCRGMLGDEYVDGGHWRNDQLEYRLLKAYERRAFHRAEGMVVLTEALRSWMRETRAVPERTPIAVIPCCVELDRFHGDEPTRVRARAELGIEGDRFALVYSGSLGSWYQEDEMAAYAARLQRLRPDLVWIVFTRADASRLRARAKELGVTDVRVRSATPDDMPRLLPAGDLGMSFIRPCFSKTGSSPTKVAEYLASGMPVAVNDGIGDQGRLGAHPGACVVLPTYDEVELDRAAAAAVDLATRPFAARAAASLEVVKREFSVADLGVPRYEALYRQLLGAG